MPNETIRAFIDRWLPSGAAERANKDHFFLELCDALGVERPDPARDKHPQYRFEKDVKIPTTEGKVGTESIDFYKKDHFVIEAKQGSEAEDEKRGTARRGTAGWDKAILDLHKRLNTVRMEDEKRRIERQIAATDQATSWFTSCMG